MTEPEVEVEVKVEPEGAAEPEVVVVAPEAGAVDDALALVEHVEEDVDKWVANESAHNAFTARIDELQRELWSRATAPEPAVETVEEIVEEAVEEAIEEAATEGEIEVDIAPVEPEPEPAKHGASWDVFEDIHGTR